MASPIVLETIAAPGATPIANRAASSKSFVNDYCKLGPGALSIRDAKTIDILGLVYKLNNAGGANYKSNHAGLIQDAGVYTQGISLFNLITAMAALDWNTGKVADSTLSTDVWSLLNEGRDLSQLTEDTLDRIIAFLRAQMRT